MTPSEGDPALRRFERDTVVACAVMCVLAFVGVTIDDGAAAGARAALGVIGGGLLMALSYRAIKGGAEVVTHAAEAVARPEVLAGTVRDEVSEDGAGPGPGPALSFGRRAFLAVKFFTRYALLAVAAYVMLTCFRLHPVGVMAGATAPFMAAVMQIGYLARALRQRERR